MATAVKIASTPAIGGGSGPVTGPPAPDVLNFQAGQRQSTGVYAAAFYADPLGQAMMFDWQADLPADTGNFGGIQIVRQIPGGAGIFHARAEEVGAALLRPRLPACSDQNFNDCGQAREEVRAPNWARALSRIPRVARKEER